MSMTTEAPRILRRARKNYLKVDTGDKKITQADLVIYTPHGYTGTEFIEEDYPEILDPGVTQNVDLLLKHLDLEADIGAIELANVVVNYVRSRTRLNVAQLTVNVPRGLIDMNRSDARIAIGKVLKSNDKHPTPAAEMLYREFSLIYHDISTSVRAQVEKISRGGVVLGMHTMAPFTPQKLPEVSPKTLAKWFSAFVEALTYGKRRNTDLIYSSPDGSTVTSDKKLVEFVTDELNKIGHPIAHNDPYAHMPKLFSSNYLGVLKDVGASWLEVDVVKDMIVKDAEGFYRPKPGINEKCVKELGEAIGRGLVRYFRTRSLRK